MSDDQAKQAAEQKRIKDALDRGIQKEFVQRNFPIYQGMPLKASVGGVLGYCAGTFAKQMSKILIWWSGLAMSLLGFLHYADYIKINWRKIDADIFWLVAKAREGGQESLYTRAQKFVTHWLPLVSSISGAFYYGFKHGD